MVHAIILEEAFSRVACASRVHLIIPSTFLICPVYVLSTRSQYENSLLSHLSTIMYAVVTHKLWHFLCIQVEREGGE